MATQRTRPSFTSTAEFTDYSDKPRSTETVRMLRRALMLGLVAGAGLIAQPAASRADEIMNLAYHGNVETVPVNWGHYYGHGCTNCGGGYGGYAGYAAPYGNYGYYGAPAYGYGYANTNYWG